MDSVGLKKNKITCCNPFNQPGHSNVRKNLRNVLPWMIKKNPKLSEGNKICDKCRKELKSITSSESEGESVVAIASCSKAPEKYEIQDSNEQNPQISDCERETAISALNQSLQNINETPIKRKRLCEKNTQKENLKKLPKQ